MKRQKTSSWKKYRPNEIKRYAKILWLLLSQKRYSEATRLLIINWNPSFWAPIIGLLVLYGIFWTPETVMGKAAMPEKPVTGFETDFETDIDWASIRQAAWSRESNINFNEAKFRLYKIYWDLGLTKTFYCDCDFTLTPKRHNRESCGLKLSKYEHALGLDAEHIVPESLMGKDKACWKHGGRKECEKDSEHQLAAGDLHNLVPSVPAINRLRSNYKPVEELPGEAYEFGTCDVEIERGSFEPPPAKRGDIARTYLYMWRVYDVPLTADDVAMFERWHREDPPDDNEIAIAKAKANMQGNINPLIK